jgi:hypothetical protein
LWKCVGVKYAPDAKRTHVQEKHSLPVSSGFLFYTRAFRSLLRVFYALTTVQDTSSKNAQLSSATTSFRDVTQTRAAITDITLSRMTLAPATIFCPGIGTRSRQKRSKRSNIVGPDIPYDLFQTKGGDVCKVWFRLVQKCEFV